MAHNNGTEITDIKIISASFQYTTGGFITMVYRTVIYISFIYTNEVLSVIRRYEFS
jgi:hypothetical protein